LAEPDYGAGAWLRASARLLVRLVMVVARNQLCNEDAPDKDPDCDAEDYEYRHSAHPLIAGSELLAAECIAIRMT
jgi:hypothetical protein